MSRFKMPSAYTIVFIALIIVAILSYFIPVSVYDMETHQVFIGATIDQYGNIVEGVGTKPAGLLDILIAPIIGFQQASDVGIALFMAGGFLSVLNYVGALEAGIGKLITKFQGSMLIAIMLFVFASLGTIFGLAEEIPAFAIVIIPLFVLAGYDVMTGLGVMFVGAALGGMASIFNPFSTGAAVAAIGNENLSLGSGILLRIVMFFVLYFVGLFLLLRYANAVKEDKQKSMLYGIDDVKTLVGSGGEMPELNKKRLVSVSIFLLIVIFLILGYVPWYEFSIAGNNLFYVVNAPLMALQNIPIIGNIIGASSITPLGEWYFNEFSVLFLLGAILLKFINNLSEKEFLTAFINGAKDMLGVVLVLSIARGISVLMGTRTQGMSVTFVYYISTAIGEAPLWLFAVLSIGAFMLIGLFLQSTSGVAGLSMPILGAVAYALFATSHIGGEGGQVILISSFTLGLSFTGWLYPTAFTLGTLEMVNVPYPYYVKFMLKFLVPFVIVGGIIILLAPYLNLI